MAKLPIRNPFGGKKPPFEIVNPSRFPDIMGGQINVTSIIVRNGALKDVKVAGAPGWISVSGTDVTVAPPSSVSGKFSSKVLAEATSGETDVKDFEQNVTAAPRFEITSPTHLPKALVGTAYAQVLTIVNNNGPVTWSKTRAPSWIGLNAGNGELSFTATSAHVGIHDLDIRATDTAGSIADKHLQVEVEQPPEFAIKGGFPKELEAEKEFSYQLKTENANGEVRFILDPSSPGMISMNARGLIKVTPQGRDVGKTVSFRVMAKDAAGNKTKKGLRFTVKGTPVTPAAAAPAPAASTPSASVPKIAALSELFKKDPWGTISRVAFILAAIALVLLLSTGATIWFAILVAALLIGIVLSPTKEETKKEKSHD